MGRDPKTQVFQFQFQVLVLELMSPALATDSNDMNKGYVYFQVVEWF